MDKRTTPFEAFKMGQESMADIMCNMVRVVQLSKINETKYVDKQHGGGGLTMDKRITPFEAFKMGQESMADIICNQVRVVLLSKINETKYVDKQHGGLFTIDFADDIIEELEIFTKELIEKAYKDGANNA